MIIDTVFEQHFRDHALVEELGLKLLAALDTHCHADHVTGAWLMQQATGCRIGISKRYGDAVQGADLRLDQGDRIPFGKSCLEVRATPGHTDGCVTYVTDGRDPAHDYNGRTMSSVGEERVHNPRIGGHADERDFVGFMENLHLPHPRQIAVAVPANLRSGKPENAQVPSPADWGPVRRNYAGLLEIDPEWVAEHLGEVHVVDVRQREELDERLGRIATAQLIPLSELKDRLDEIPRDKPVIPVCHAGMRSGQATVILREAGFTRLANLQGGMLLWQQMGLPVVRGDSVSMN